MIDKEWIDPILKFNLSFTYDINESEVTKEFLSSLQELDLSDKNIISIKGIRYATNLKALNLSGNKICDISEIAYLSSLVILELDENKIREIDCLKNLKNLKSLMISYNAIKELPDLSKMLKLTFLDISNNQISDLRAMKNILNENVKIIASNQYILLEPLCIDEHSDYCFHPNIYWLDKELLYWGNIQVSGNYDCIKTDERPSIMYSLSEAKIKNITSNCIIKADFYYEAPYLKSGILSGVIVQPLILNKSVDGACSRLIDEDALSYIYGKINIKNNFNATNIYKNKKVVLINSEGTKIISEIDNNGEYRFNNLKKDRYTILFPCIYDFIYSTKSLFVFDLDGKDNKEINTTLYNNKKNKS